MLKLDDLKDQRAAKEKEFEKAAKSSRNGKLAILLGLIIGAGFLLVSSDYGIICACVGGLVFFAGLFTWSTQSSNENKAKKELGAINEEIADTRRSLEG